MSFNKKASLYFAPGVVIMGFVILLYAAVMFQMQKPVVRQDVGEIAAGLLGKYNDGEKYLLYLEKAGEYGAYDSVYEMGFNAGLKDDGKCRKLNGYLIWSKECKPSKDNFVHYFENNLKKYIGSAYSWNNLGYEYDFETSNGINVVKALSLQTFDLSVMNRFEEEKFESPAKKPASYAGLKSGPYNDLISKYAAKHDIDLVVFMCMVKQESNFNPMAVSDAGAAGLVQLLPGAARDMGIKKLFNNVICGSRAIPRCDKNYVEMLKLADKEDDDRFDPEKNLDAGAKYFRQMLNQFGNVRNALAAYNAGPGNFKKFNVFADSRFRETQIYVNNIQRCIEQNNGMSITGRAVENTDKEGESEITGYYEINASFLIRFEYDFSDYEMVYDAVTEKVNSGCLQRDDYKKCLLNELGMEWDIKSKENGIVTVEVKTKQKIERFNIKDDDFVLIRFGIDLNNWEKPKEVVF